MKVYIATETECTYKAPVKEKIVSSPNFSTACSEKECGHIYGKHYVSADGTICGCSAKNSRMVEQRDLYKVETPCTCTGFAMKFKMQPRIQEPERHVDWPIR